MGGYFPEWTKEEVDFLLKNYHKMKNRELGERLGGRSAKAICQKYSRLVGFNRETIKGQKISRTITKVDVCPECKSTRVNTVEEGYFCVNCLTEYDKFGNMVYY